jgi:antirestriction protein ArdC
MTTAKISVPYNQLLQEAVNKPGVLSKCYSRFHSYSLGNQLWAWLQSLEHKLDLGPIATYKQWQSLGRQVKKGSEAIYLTLPVIIDEKDANGNKTGKQKRLFLPKKNWFFLSQTEGDEYVETIKSAVWDKERAFKALDITQIPFDKTDGNCQGFARGRSVAVSDIAVLPHKTLFHEIAHVTLGHTLEHELEDSELTPQDIKEVEAESVAYILCQLLGLPGEQESRGYIQHWLNGQSIDDKSAKRIFSAADKILKAGSVQ